LASLTGDHPEARGGGFRSHPSPTPRRQFAQAEGAEHCHRLTGATGYGTDHVRPAGEPPPRPTSIGMPGRHHRNPHQYGQRGLCATLMESRGIDPCGLDDHEIELLNVYLTISANDRGHDGFHSTRAENLDIGAVSRGGSVRIGQREEPVKN